MVEVLLAGAEDHRLRQVLLQLQRPQQRPEDSTVLIDQLLHAQAVLGVVAVAGAFKTVGRVALQLTVGIVADAPHLYIIAGGPDFLLKFLHHAVVFRRKAAVAGQRFIEVLRLHQTQMQPRLGVRLGQHRRGQVVFIELSREAVAHPPVEADLEGQQERQQRAVPPGVVLKVLHHEQRRTLFLVQRMHLQRHQAAGGLHFAEEVHGEQDQLHGGNQYAVLEKAHRLYLTVLPQLQPVLFPIVPAALRVQRFIRRVGIEVDVQIGFNVRLRQGTDVPLRMVGDCAHVLALLCLMRSFSHILLCDLFKQNFCSISAGAFNGAGLKGI